jgi:hypothetical protein
MRGGGAYHDTSSSLLHPPTTAPFQRTTTNLLSISSSALLDASPPDFTTHLPFDLLVKKGDGKRKRMELKIDEGE